MQLSSIASGFVGSVVEALGATALPARGRVEIGTAPVFQLRT
ncbi:MAG: hypothetical protein R3F56_08430 [Planctomycetota bacterium]